MTTGSGVIADIFPPEGRGTASGIFMIPLLIGPVSTWGVDWGSVQGSTAVSELHDCMTLGLAWVTMHASALTGW